MTVACAAGAEVWTGSTVAVADAVVEKGCSAATEEDATGDAEEEEDTAETEPDAEAKMSFWAPGRMKSALTDL